MLVDANRGHRPPGEQYPWLVLTHWLYLPHWREAELWCIHTFDLELWTRYAGTFYFSQEHDAFLFLLRWEQNG